VLRAVKARGRAAGRLELTSPTRVAGLPVLAGVSENAGAIDEIHSASWRPRVFWTRKTLCGARKVLPSVLWAERAPNARIQGKIKRLADAIGDGYALSW
jgi:hypothetical protein